MSDSVRVGVVGCGAISGAYLGMAKSFGAVTIAAVADLDADRAKTAAERFGVPRALTVEQLLADPDIELVLNLTVPKAHTAIAMAALESGKHTYAEKPLGIDREDGRRVIELATSKHLRVGCAPDTFLGAGLQTARKLIDDGAIGRPVAFTANMQCRGHESWHPSPEFYYEAGGGPMFDMGPYYLTALLNLFGPAKRISGMAAVAVPERTITSQPKHGQKIKVQTPDHIVGLIEFANGCLGTITQSFAVIDGGYDGGHPIIVNGTDGVLYVPDPNAFDGTVRVRRAGERAAVEVPPLFSHRLRPQRRLGRHGRRDPQRPAAPVRRPAGVRRARPDAGLPRQLRHRHRPPADGPVHPAGGDAGPPAVRPARHLSSLKDATTMPPTRRLLILPLLAVAAAPPATRPAAPRTDDLVSLGKDAVRFHAPPSPKWVFHAQADASTDKVRFVDEDDRAVCEVQIVPMELSADTDGQYAASIVKALKERHQKAGDVMAMQPTVEHDKRFDIVVHERLTKAGQTVDQVHVYKSVGPKVVELTALTTAADPADAKAALEAAKAALASAKYNRPGSTAGRARTPRP